MRLLQKRQNNPAFQPKWSTENESEWRGAIHAIFEKMTAAYQDKDCPNVKLLPVWHGTRPEILPSLFKTGFASLASADAGYFGKGHLFAYEAEYSYRVYSKGALIDQLVCCFSAYPVIDGDMLNLKAKPIMPIMMRMWRLWCLKIHSIQIPKVIFLVKPGQRPQYTEVVVFESCAMLPRYLVELQASLLKAPASVYQKKHLAILLCYMLI